jgi:adenylosuccinate synthase
VNFVVVGLGFGDEGKGSLVDALVRRHGVKHVVRFNGGPQAAHHVVTSDGVTHCFAQFGAGTLAGASTFLGPEVACDPLALEREAEVLVNAGVTDPLARHTVDERTILVTPMHKLVNRIQEIARGANRHGSCGKGVGQALLDAQHPSRPSVRAADVRSIDGLRKKLRHLQLVKIDMAEQIPGADPELLGELRRNELVEDLIAEYARIFLKVTIDDGTRLKKALDQGAVLEGAQGTLLDADRGFFPHVTPSRTTFANADALLGDRPATRIGALRAYSTRHGAGPFVPHAPPMDAELPEKHNVENPWQGVMRVGWFDLVAARYALSICGAFDGLAVTCLDRLAPYARVRACVSYDGADRIVFPGPEDRAAQTAATSALGARAPVHEDVTAPIADWIGEALGKPILIRSSGETAADKQLA